MIIDEEFSIDRDRFSWILKQKKLGINPETDKAYTGVNSTFHSTLAQALNAYVDASLKPVNSAIKVLERLRELEGKINNLEVSNVPLLKLK